MDEVDRGPGRREGSGCPLLSQQQGTGFLAPVSPGFTPQTPPTRNQGSRGQAWPMEASCLPSAARIHPKHMT